MVAPVFLKIKSSHQSDRLFCSLNKVHVHVEEVAILVLEILLAFAINLGHVVILAVDLHPVNLLLDFFIGGFGHHGNLIEDLGLRIKDLLHGGKRHFINIVGLLIIDQIGLYGGQFILHLINVGLLIIDQLAGVYVRVHSNFESARLFLYLHVELSFLLLFVVSIRRGGRLLRAGAA